MPDVELLLAVLFAGDVAVPDDSDEIDDPPLRGILLRMWFLAFGVSGASGGPNRRLYESLPGLLRGDTAALSVPLMSPKRAEPSWDWLWALMRRGLVSSGAAPKISLLPPPGGFNTLKSRRNNERKEEIKESRFKKIKIFRTSWYSDKCIFYTDMDWIQNETFFLFPLQSIFRIS